MSDVKWWRVEVSDEAGQIVAIEPEMLAGRETGDHEETTIRKAVLHLIGFVGGLAPTHAGAGLIDGVMELFPGADRQSLNCLAQLLEKKFHE